MLEGGVDAVLFVDVVVVRVGGADSDAADVGELFQGSGFDDGAVSDDADVVGEFLDFGEDVAGQKDCCAFVAAFSNDVDECLFDEWVESGGGFVKDEDIDVGGEGGDEHDFLPVAFGVGADFFGGVEFESFNVFGAFFLVVTGGSEFGEGVEDLVAGEVGEEFYIPWDVGDVVDGGFGGVGVVDAEGSGGGVDESEEAADGG